MGFPIRTSSDHGSFANSPRLIAGYNVLLRLLVPRHPPCALKNLTTAKLQIPKIKSLIYKDARVHCAVLKLPTTPPPHRAAPTDTRASEETHAPAVHPPGMVRANQKASPKPRSRPHPKMRRLPTGPVPSGPNSVLELPQTTGTMAFPPPEGDVLTGAPAPELARSQCSTHERPTPGTFGPSVALDHPAPAAHPTKEARRTDG